MGCGGKRGGRRQHAGGRWLASRRLGPPPLPPLCPPSLCSVAPFVWGRARPSGEKGGERHARRARRPTPVPRFARTGRRPRRARWGGAPCPSRARLLASPAARRGTLCGLVGTGREARGGEGANGGGGQMRRRRCRPPCLPLSLPSSPAHLLTGERTRNGTRAPQDRETKERARRGGGLIPPPFGRRAPLTPPPPLPPSPLPPSSHLQLRRRQPHAPPPRPADPLPGRALRPALLPRRPPPRAPVRAAAGGVPRGRLRPLPQARHPGQPGRLAGPDAALQPGARGGGRLPRV